MQLLKGLKLLVSQLWTGLVITFTFSSQQKDLVYLSLLKASKDEVINFCNSFKEEKQYILLQMTINDEQNDSSVERSFPTPQPANPFCVFCTPQQTFKNTQAKRETTSGIPEITVLLRKSQCVFTQMSC